MKKKASRIKILLGRVKSHSNNALHLEATTRCAFLSLSEANTSLADITTIDSKCGITARCEAVRARLKCGEIIEAYKLYNRYMTEAKENEKLKDALTRVIASNEFRHSQMLCR